MFCVACGGDVPAGSRFCPRCGRAVNPSDASAAPDAPLRPGGDAPPASPPSPSPPPAPPPPPPPPPGSGYGSRPPTGSGSRPPTDHGAPPAGYRAPPAGYGAPPAGYGAPPAGYGAPPGGYGPAPGAYPPPPYGAGASGPVPYGLASFGQRAGAFLIDGFITWAMLMFGLLVAGMTAPEATFDTPDPGPNALGWLFILAATLAAIFYFPFFEGRPEGQTPGKRGLGIRVVRQSDGGPLGYLLAFGRTMARFFDYFLFGLGLLWAIWDPERQTWHDKIAGTVVVRSSVYPPPSSSAVPNAGY